MALDVLVWLVRMAVCEVPGVVRPGSVPRSNLLGAATGEGIAIQASGREVLVDCYVIAAPETQLLELGMAVQATVGAVVRELAGMVAREVNVYIQDVEASHG